MGYKLRLRELYAKDETNTAGTEWGSDDMYVGGAGIELRGPSLKPTVHKINPFKVGSFDDGDRKKYQPARELADFGLGSGVFPKHITFTLFIAERDRGADLNKFYEDLCKEMDNKAASIKADIASGAMPAGEQDKKNYWIEAAKVIVDFSIQVYKTWKGDEMFVPQVVNIIIPNESFRWNGSDTSREEVLDFKGHGGHYILKYDWSLMR